jgi:hypothetical protein
MVFVVTVSYILSCVGTDKRLMKDRPDLSSERADPIVTALARTSSNSKLQTRPLLRGRFKITNSNCLKENLEEKEKLVAGPRWAPDTMSDWLTDCRS